MYIIVNRPNMGICPRHDDGLVKCRIQLEYPRTALRPCPELGFSLGSEVLTVQDKMVEMQNGCICCTLRDDLIQHVTHLAEEKRFDYLLIETGTKLAAEQVISFQISQEYPRMGQLFFIYCKFIFYPVKTCDDDSHLTFLFNFYAIHFRIYNLHILIDVAPPDEYLRMSTPR